MKDKKELEAEGYDTYMVFVMTSLEVAQARNKERDRVLPERILKRSWEDTRKNLGAYKSTFGSNFAMVDNSNYLSAKEARHKFSSLIKGFANKNVDVPVYIQFVPGVVVEVVHNRKSLRSGGNTRYTNSIIAMPHI